MTSVAIGQTLNPKLYTLTNVDPGKLEDASLLGPPASMTGKRYCAPSLAVDAVDLGCCSGS